MLRNASRRLGVYFRRGKSRFGDRTVRLRRWRFRADRARPNVALMLFVVVLIALGVNEWRYQRELGAVVVMEQAGAYVQWSDDAHQWAEGIPFLHGRLQHVVFVDLDTIQLTALPPEIGKLTNLVSLELSGNQLTKLPPEIGKLTKLEGLSLTNNQLTTLPPEIGKLTKLEGLWLDGNPITDSDLEHLKSLENLQVLDLAGTNSITSATAKVTPQGVAALKLALPKCDIKSNF